MSYKLQSADLPKLWRSPDNSRLTAKQLSIRLPVHVAAKIFALEQMYPTKTRTQIIGDLLACALAELEESLQSEKGECLGPGPDGKYLYEDIGERGQFFRLADEHLRELERQLGNLEPETIKQWAVIGEAPDEDGRSE